MIAGVTALRVALVRQGLPLPAQETEKHYRFQDENRRYGLQVLDAVRIMLAAPFLAVALRHGIPGLQQLEWVRWGLVALIIALWLFMMLVIYRGKQRLDEMSAGLQPIESWGCGALALRKQGFSWAVAYFGGLILLFLLLRR